MNRSLNRRRFLQASATPLLLTCGSKLLKAAPAAHARPPFHVLYSNDTTNTLTCVSPWHKRGEPFRPEMLEHTVDEVAGSGVEVHLLQPGLGWIPWWKSKVYPADAHYRWFQERTGRKPDSFGQYMLDGGDMVRVFIDRCRRRGQTPFISLRMNDGHHLESAGQPSSNSVWASRFYVDHPEWRIGADPQRWGDRVMNWAIPEVRAHKLAFVRELCENYDLDGFELDFMRFYSLFPLDRTTGDQRRTIVAHFVREVRSLLDRTARGGRRRWLCARVPCYLAAHDPLGIDLPEMVSAGLDMVNVSASYFTVQQTDLPAICRLVPQAAVYLELCHSIWNGKGLSAKGYDNFPFRRATPEQMQTAAHLAFARGAAGVSAFNFVYYREHGGAGRGPFQEPPFGVFRHLGDRAWLANQPQHYFLAQGWSTPFKKPILPRAVGTGKTALFELDLAPPAGGWRHGGRIRVQCEQPLGDSRWEARLNGAPLAATDDRTEPYANPYPPMLGRPEEMRAWLVPATALRDGVNRVEVSLRAGDPARIVLLDLAVR